MPTLLLIETSTRVCSVALTHDGAVVFHRENFEGPAHAQLLGPYVKEALEQVKKNNLQLDAVGVSCGPGSYTGLRIGISHAKGICYGLNIPLIAIETLQLMACSVLFTQHLSEDTLLCPMIDARRMEVYAAIYNQGLTAIKPVSPDIIDTNSYHDIIDNNRILLFGNGAEKCKEVLSHPNITYIDGVDPLAQHGLALAEKAFREGLFVDLAYFEPMYLKEFMTTTPRNKI